MSPSGAAISPTEMISPRPGGRTWALFGISILGLYLELLLIRWIGTEIRIFAYLQNTILVVCFMGLGMGCLTCRKPFVLRDLLVPLLALVSLMAVPFIRKEGLGKISQMLSSFGGVLIWWDSSLDNPWHEALFGAVGLCLTFMLMLLTWEIFVPMGRLLGRLLDDHPRTIWAYSVNVAGSLVGIWLFVLLSVFYLPPVIWFAVAAGFFLCFLSKSGKERVIELALVLGIVALAWVAGREEGEREVWWSPYQKLVLERKSVDYSKGDDLLSYHGTGEYFVYVNNVGFQVMFDASKPDPRGRLDWYELPLLFHAHPRKLLIVGAGTGNDAAGALRAHVEQITAVEIDPGVIALGTRYHPEQPYRSPAVQLVNDDARAYFATATDRYDVISFATLDAHTTTALTNARLDHYVYTRESFQRAKDLLTDGGILVVRFECQRPYIADRLFRVLSEMFGQEPLAFSGGGEGMWFVAGDQARIQKQIASQPQLKALVDQLRQDHPVSLPGLARVATDDWPYLYLESPGVPVLYYFLAGLLLLLFLWGAKRLQVPGLVGGWDWSRWHFFFLGAAFLLLEVQNISKASVVLGNTWLVNAVIITGVLSMVLLANWIVARFPGLPLRPVYALLCGSCLALYFLDISRFAFLPYATKAILVGGLTSLPMLFSGIVFIRSFASVTGKDLALGANLFGALVGGLLQSITFLTGIKALLLIVAALYFAAFLTRPRRQQEQRAAELIPAIQTAGFNPAAR